MSKTRFKVLLSVLLVLVISTTYCFATTEPETSAEDANALISTLGGEGEGENGEATQNAETPETDPSANWFRNDLYKIDNSVTVSQVVDGNIFIIGKDVKISSEVGGDVFVIAEKLEIDGAYIYSSIFAMANEITINGTVYDVYATCNKFNIGENGLIYRDLRLLAQDLNISGVVNRNAYVSVENITFAENASGLIRGNLNYSSSKQISIPTGAVVGQTNFSQEQVKESGNGFLSHLLSLIIALVITLIITLVLTWLTPMFVERVGNTNLSKSFISIGIGFLAFIGFMIIAVILVMSIIGLPIFVSATFAFLTLRIVGRSVVSIFFGKIFVKKLHKDGKWNLVLYTLISTAIIWLICQIPFVGNMFFSALVSIFGIGLTLVNMISKGKNFEVQEQSEVKE